MQAVELLDIKLYEYPGASPLEVTARAVPVPVVPLTTNAVTPADALDTRINGPVVTNVGVALSGTGCCMMG